MLSSLRLLVVHLLLLQLLVGGVIERQATITEVNNSRQKRALPLIFQPGSVIQFIAGFGIPVEDLEYETVTTGIIFDGLYRLPSSVAALRTHTTLNVNARDSVRNFVNNTQFSLAKYRWVMYRAMEQWVQRSGYNGQACLLKAICEASKHPFQTDGGILDELFHILFTPSSSADDLNVKEAAHYINAEKLGQQGAECEVSFKECKVSFLDKVSDIFDMNFY